MPDPRERLLRPIPGASVQPDESAADRIEAVFLRPEPVPPVPARDQQELKVPVVRASRRQAVAGPNAPQLVRLIRSPYALPVGRPRRIELIAPAPRRVEGNWRDDFAAGLAERDRVRSTSPARGRVRPFAVHPAEPNPIPPLDGEPR